MQEISKLTIIARHSWVLQLLTHRCWCYLGNLCSCRTQVASGGGKLRVVACFPQQQQQQHRQETRCDLCNPIHTRASRDPAQPGHRLAHPPVSLAPSLCCPSEGFPLCKHPELCCCSDCVRVFVHSLCIQLPLPPSASLSIHSPSLSYFLVKCAYVWVKKKIPYANSDLCSKISFWQIIMSV